MKNSKSICALFLILLVALSFESNAQTRTNTSWWNTFKSYFDTETPTKAKTSETLRDRMGGTKETSTPVKDKPTSVKTPTTVKDNPGTIKDRPGSVKDRPTPVKTPSTVKDNPESIKDRPGSVKDRPTPVKTPTTVKDQIKTRPTQEPAPDKSTNVSSSSKAKCGVPGCQHPGKHEGLHKHQEVVSPILFEKGKGEYKENNEGKKNENKGKNKNKNKGKNK